jgi:hypothetical protein
MQYERGFGFVGHVGRRSSANASHFSTREASSSRSASEEAMAPLSLTWRGFWSRRSGGLLSRLTRIRGSEHHRTVDAFIVVVSHIAHSFGPNNLLALIRLREWADRNRGQ